MNRRSVVDISRAALIAICALGPVACVNIGANDLRYVEQEEKRFTTSDRPQLRLETFDGSIEVTSWDRLEVLVEIEKRGADREAVTALHVETGQLGDEVTVKAVRPPGSDNTLGWDRHPSVALRVTAPRSAVVHARSGDGRIVVRALRGDLDVQTGDGSIRLEDVAGAVDAQSGDGSINIDGVMTRLRARSHDGSVRVRANEGSAAIDDWSISSGDGSIRLELPRRFNAELDAHSGDGRVSVDESAMTMQRRDDRSSVRGRLGDGGRDLRVRTGDGSITIRQD